MNYIKIINLHIYIYRLFVRNYCLLSNRTKKFLYREIAIIFFIISFLINYGAKPLLAIETSNNSKGKELTTRQIVFSREFCRHLCKELQHVGLKELGTIISAGVVGGSIIGSYAYSTAPSQSKVYEICMSNSKDMCSARCIVENGSWSPRSGMQCLNLCNTLEGASCEVRSEFFASDYGSTVAAASGFLGGVVFGMTHCLLTMGLKAYNKTKEGMKKKQERPYRYKGLKEVITGDSIRNFLKGSSQDTQSSGANSDSEYSEDDETCLRYERNPIGLVFNPTVGKNGVVAMLIGHNVGAQISSLLSMQYILVGAAEQVITALKALALKVHEHSDKVEIHSSSRHGLLHTVFIPNHPKLQHSQNGWLPYHVFGFMDGHQSNLEYKARSSQFGIHMNLSKRTIFGLAYNKHKDEVKEAPEISLGNSSGAVTSKAQTESIAAAFVVNPSETGLTSHVVSCYGWGKAKTNHTVTHNEIQFYSKGKPNVYLVGSLLQVGYNVLVSKQVLLTPYVESMISRVQWSTYKEHVGILPCKISSNREKVWEYSVGLRIHWRVSSNSQLQTWIAAISGNQNIASMSSKPFVLPLKRYEIVVPSYKKKYTKTELGAVYSSTVTDSLQIALNGKACFTNHKLSGIKVMNLSMQYVY